MSTFGLRATGFGLRGVIVVDVAESKSRRFSQLLVRSP
jgi:hypothetical protein